MATLDASIRSRYNVLCGIFVLFFFFRSPFFSHCFHFISIKKKKTPATTAVSQLARGRVRLRRARKEWWEFFPVG